MNGFRGVEMKGEIHTCVSAYVLMATSMCLLDDFGQPDVDMYCLPINNGQKISEDVDRM